MSNTSEDIWAKALATLSADDSQHLNLASQHDKRQIVVELLKATEERRDQCIQNRLKLRLISKKGDAVIWWDVYGKMVKWIQKFIQVGDAAMQYDPGHAALPWAAVRFILQISVNQVENMDCVMEGVEMLSRTISRYAIYEEIYLSQTSQAVDELKKSLTSLYTSVLLYLSKAKTFLLQKTHMSGKWPSQLVMTLFGGAEAYCGAERFINAISDPKAEFIRLPSDLTAAEACIDQWAHLVQTEISNLILDSVQKLSWSEDEHYEKLRKLLEDIDGPIDRMGTRLKGMEDNLDTPDPYDRGKAETDFGVDLTTAISLLPSRDLPERTGPKVRRLAAQQPGFQRLKERQQVFTAMVAWDARFWEKYTHHELDGYGAGRSPMLAYFYCSQSEIEQERSRPAEILASIARQLSSLEPGLPIMPPVISEYEKKEYGSRPGSLTLAEYRDLIVGLIEYFPMTTIIIDALDECEYIKRFELIDALVHIIEKSSNLVKVFLSSRDDGDLVKRFELYPKIETASQDNLKDVERFVRWKVDEEVAAGRLLEDCAAKDELKNVIIEKTVKGARGMFRWADMQIALILSLTSEEDIRSQIDQAPPKLEELYDKLYENITVTWGRVGRLIIDNVFKWLLSAQRPFESAEFFMAVSMNLPTPLTDVTKSKLLKLCRSFILFDEGLDVFRFAHLSVQEYLAKRVDFLPQNCGAFAAEACLASLFATSRCETAAKFLERDLKINTVANCWYLQNSFHLASTHMQTITGSIIVKEQARLKELPGCLSSLFNFSCSMSLLGTPPLRFGFRSMLSRTSRRSLILGG